MRNIILLEICCYFLVTFVTKKNNSLNVGILYSILLFSPLLYHLISFAHFFPLFLRRLHLLILLPPFFFLSYLFFCFFFLLLSFLFFLFLFLFLLIFRDYWIYLEMTSTLSAYGIWLRVCAKSICY